LKQLGAALVLAAPAAAVHHAVLLAALG
jgi:hypothetical protein